MYKNSVHNGTVIVKEIIFCGWKVGKMFAFFVDGPTWQIFMLVDILWTGSTLIGFACSSHTMDTPIWINQISKFDHMAKDNMKVLIIVFIGKYSKTKISQWLKTAKYMPLKNYHLAIWHIIAKSISTYFTLAFFWDP